MPRVNEGKQNKGMNNTPYDKQEAINKEYYSRLSKPRFSARVIKFGQRIVPIRTVDGIKDVYVVSQDEIKQGGHTNSKLYNYSNKHRNHPIKGAYAREVDSWENDTSPIKAIANSGIGYALTPFIQALYDYTRGAIDISKEPTKASNYLLVLPTVGNIVKAPLKRGVEVVMRTSNDANPIEDILYYFNKASLRDHAGVVSYITTGIGHNTYAPEAYTGFQKAAKGNDMIDAYLYNKIINPSYGVKKVRTEYGPHEDYIRVTYPYKDIPVYENTETIDFYTNKPLKEATNVTNKTAWKGTNNNLDFGDRGVDAAGHLVQEGMSNGKKVYRAQDIWKFNPDEYKKKWSSFDLDSKAILGLKILDKLGTPVITRTPWLFR